MARPMYGQPPRWWDRVWMWERRPWAFIVRTRSWVWYDSVFRFNGGGWTHGADPYIEWQVGCFVLRKYGMSRKG